MTMAHAPSGEPPCTFTGLVTSVPKFAMMLVQGHLFLAESFETCRLQHVQRIA